MILESFMIEVMSIEAFIKSEELDINDETRETVSVRIDTNRLKYLKYLSYKTGRSVSTIVNDSMCLNTEGFSSSSESGTLIEDTYATVIWTKLS